MEGWKSKVETRNCVKIWRGKITLTLLLQWLRFFHSP